MASDGAPDGSEVQLSAGTLKGVAINGAEMTVQLGDVPDATCLAVTLSGITNFSGSPLAEDSDVHVAVLCGDQNGDGIVDIEDLVGVKANRFAPLDELNYRSDINVDGIIDISDLVVTKSHRFHSASCP